ncbi:MAG: hypothetical protein NVS9B7_09330 [Flavisolibacter sp.]
MKLLEAFSLSEVSILSQEIKITIGILAKAAFKFKPEIRFKYFSFSRNNKYNRGL